MPSSSEKSLTDTILSILSGDGGSKKDTDGGLKVKKLRKMVLLSLQMDESDKAAKKAFKKAVQALEEEKRVKLNEAGHIFFRKKDKKEKKKKKRSPEAVAQESSFDESPSNKSDEPNDKPANKRAKHESDSEIDNTGETGAEAPPAKNKNVPCKGNPSGETRLFLGNLPFAVDEAGLKDFLPGITHYKWITDKETGRFYGSAFVEMDNSVSAAAAVAKAGKELMGRPVKVNYAPARPGDIWPPQKTVQTGGGGGGQAGGTGIKALGEKPPDCVKLFIGNLSYEIDDDAITKFFGSVDAEIKAVRWLHHRDTGDFKGVGFVEFWKTEACEKAASLNGKNLLGRPIRIDWSD